MKAFKTLVKPFEALQRSVKTKIELKVFLFVWERLNQQLLTYGQPYPGGIFCFSILMEIIFYERIYFCNALIGGFCNALIGGL